MSANKQQRFLPTTKAEMDARGWEQCDVILVSGDAYIDSPFIGVADPFLEKENLFNPMTLRQQFLGDLIG